MKKIGSFWIACLLCVHGFGADVDLLIFSYDRPMQLYALLESIEANVTGLSTETVIYRTSSERSEAGYQIIQDTFPHVIFRAQDSKHAKADFKPLVMQSMFNKDSETRYALFAVDDIIVTRPIDLDLAIDRLEQNNAYCFFFRLGLNINYCYSMNIPTRVPKGIQLEPNIFSWVISHGKGDWGYPNNVDFTLYRKKDIVDFFHATHFTFPNDLEGAWASKVKKNVKGLCHSHSCMVNIPMNVVSSYNNRQMHFKDAKELLDLFHDGYKMNIEPIQNLMNNSPHFEMQPEFILRK